ncbi:MAG: hypothetical protein ABIN91_07350 [Mucilaginibacter sp.]|uniref:hypothetical protein n=1 Tax=Mucilaginibacter sp. TaxID=1882438 RepID=UPI0032662F27
MSSLRNVPVRIIVHKPNHLSVINLFTTIVNDRGKKIMVKLNHSIKGIKIESDLLELKPTDPKETFKPLTQYYSVMINGTLINGDESEYVLSGSVTID